MTTKIKNTTVAKESSNAAVDSVSKITITAMGIVSGLIGLWSIASIVSAFASNGIGATIRGFVSAVTGM